MNWDSWRGSMDGRPVLWEKHLFCRWGCHIDLHKMIGLDDPDCFHTHPAYAIRIILYGGYVDAMESGWLRTWRPGMMGIVEPSLSHRVARLRNGRVSYSLWIRFRKCAKVHLRGSGWQKQEQTYRVTDTVLVPPQRNRI